MQVLGNDEKARQVLEAALDKDKVCVVEEMRLSSFKEHMPFSHKRNLAFNNKILPVFTMVKMYLSFQSWGISVFSVRNKASPSDNDWLKLLRSDWFEIQSDKLTDA